jgi:hypothetical protein
MKKLYSLAVVSAIILFSSCAKLDPENKIVGTWKLDDVVKRKFLNNDHLHTGYESGLFTFSDNGTVTYTDTVTLSGNWRMHREDRSYYDSDGNYQQRNNLVLRIRLANFVTNRFIDWDFDDIDFKRSSNRLDGFIYSAFSSYQYSFRRQ